MTSHIDEIREKINLQIDRQKELAPISCQGCPNLTISRRPNDPDDRTKFLCTLPEKGTDIEVSQTQDANIDSVRKASAGWIKDVLTQETPSDVDADGTSREDAAKRMAHTAFRGRLEESISSCPITLSLPAQMAGAQTSDTVLLNAPGGVSFARDTTEIVDSI